MQEVEKIHQHPSFEARYMERGFFGSFIAEITSAHASPPRAFVRPEIVQQTRSLRGDLEDEEK